MPKSTFTLKDIPHSVFQLAILISSIFLSACGSSSNGNSPQPTANTHTAQTTAAQTPAQEPEAVDNSPQLLNIALSWEIPATREDGSALPLDEIGGYEITYHLDGQIQHFSVKNAQTTSTTLSNLANTNYTFSIYTFDHNNIVSSSASQVTYLARQ